MDRETTNDDETSFIVKLQKKYDENKVPQTAVNLIPYVGGALHNLLSGGGNKIQYQRMMRFLEDLDYRLKELEIADEVDFSEEFYDLSVSIIEGAIQSRHDEKRQFFSSLLAHKIAMGNAADWSDAEAAARILKELDVLHVKILDFANSVPACGSPFDDLNVFQIDGPDVKPNQAQPLELKNKFPNYPTRVLRMAASELVAKGLLYDEGVGRLSTKAMNYFLITDLGTWFLEWLSLEP